MQATSALVNRPQLLAPRNGARRSSAVAPLSPVSARNPLSPVPQSPLSPCMSSPASSCGEELMPAHIAAGWTRCWSTTESRPYYDNKTVGRTVWHVAEIDHPPEHTRRRSRHVSREAATVGVTRQPSQDAPKKEKLEHFQCGHIDQQIWSNVRVAKRGLVDLLPAHPEIESRRCATVRRLRREFKGVCERAGIELNTVAFQRWLMDSRLIREQTHELVLPVRNDEERVRMLFHVLHIDPTTASEEVTRELRAFSAEVCAAGATILREHIEKLRDCRIHLTNSPEQLLDEEVTACVPVASRHPSPLLPSPTHEQVKENRRIILLKFGEETISLSADAFFRLEKLYHEWAFDDVRYSLYLARTWAVLKRYEGEMSYAFGFGNDNGPWKGDLYDPFYSTLPSAVFRCLAKDFGVTFECFATPLNCYFKQYCSMFADTDAAFGSRGSFFEFTPKEGSLLVQPPNEKRHRDLAVERVLELIEKETESLSFVVVLTQSRSPAQAFSLLETSRYVRGRRTIASQSVRLRHAFAHLPGFESAPGRASGCSLEIFVVQNDEGARRWPCDEERLARLEAAFTAKSKGPLQQPA